MNPASLIVRSETTKLLIQMLFKFAHADLKAYQIQKLPTIWYRVHFTTCSFFRYKQEVLMRLQQCYD